MKYTIEARTNRKNKDGLCEFRMRISDGAEKKYITLDVFADYDLWDSKKQLFDIILGVRDEAKKARNESNKGNNKLFGSIKTKLEAIEKRFTENKIVPTVNQIIDEFSAKKQTGKILDYWNDHIETLKATGHIGNSLCYSNTLHMVEMFDSKFKERTFQEIDLSFVKRFDVWLQKRGCKGNTRKYYHKALRALLNKAIQDGQASESTYPYGKGRFNVADLEEETEKRYLKTDVMVQIKASTMDNTVIEMTRRIFLAQYYCYGISFIDAALLTTKNIFQLESGTYIVYKRQKTKNAKKVKPINIKITPDLQAHLDWFAQNTDRLGNYLFPIVSREYKGEQLYKHIRSRFVTNNKHLKGLAKELGLDENTPLTSYVSRHTMAMTLQNNNIAREKISQMLGHGDIKVTATYLDSFDSEELAKAAEVL